MTVKIVELSSGFGNVPNSFILAEYYHGSLSGRPGSAYDEFYTIELPDGFTVEENVYGENMIWHGNDHVEIVSVNHAKRWLTGVSLDGYHHFPITSGV